MVPKKQIDAVAVAVCFKLSGIHQNHRNLSMMGPPDGSDNKKSYQFNPPFFGGLKERGALLLAVFFPLYPP